MAVESQHQHVPGPLKQKNKNHKHGNHKSKRELAKASKGRVNLKTLSKKNSFFMKKTERKNQSAVLRKQKREEAFEKKRQRGTSGTPPTFVVIVSLHRDVNTDSCLECLKTCDDELIVKRNEQGITHFTIPRFKKRASFFIPEYGNLNALLDAVKVADTLLLLISPQDGIDDYGEYCLSCLFGQGLPAVTLACPGFKNLAVKKQSEARKSLQNTIEKRFPSEKFHALDTPQDALMIVRQLTDQKLRPVYYRENRSHMVAENITFELESSESQFGVLKVTGYLRGRTLNVNGLVHLPGWGDFQMNQIDSATDPYPLQPRKYKNKSTGDVDMEKETVHVLDKVDPKQQESLETEVIPDPMEGEQTWPTDEELAEAEAQAKNKILKRVPKGTSEYQATWIVDDDEVEEHNDKKEDDDEEDDDSDVDEFKDAMETVDSDEERNEDDEEFETMTVTENNDDEKYDANMDMDEEIRVLEKLKEERQHAMFPDEVDTPMDIPARTRFARYRGLKSFRTSPWDPKENLPSDYSRIFQFDKFKMTRKKVLNQENDDGALPGWYITIHINKVPKEFMESYKPGTPVILFGILPHEQKMSLLHFAIRKYATATQPIKSKDRLIFHVGFRRFTACPIFSQHTTGNKHKFERFLPADTTCVATVYAPITFAPVPVLVFQHTPEGSHDLVATGSLLSVNPDRIVAKRIVLSGHPKKIHKRSAVIRYLFYNREDIYWFKPVELRTKWGRRGHIKEALGTHGHMKCVFDGGLKSQDTVLMNLYKRMFPKWTYNPHVESPPVINEYKTPMETIDEEDMEAQKLFD
ncbi:pre-rRNA-processing protein TSR1 homolog [Patella vulgata]|uniref:pre-rRNA-processing protein TSR1 homolog n=1 Tax=Patella vulgata TaxID=6465 RepID=UPI0024A84561|nr:pre-rRNA-processing protein TSR1 homolog [Patella vulgata]